ncbi:MAG TPA: PRC-barrel domain-containing protein [Galbitalea sp.]|jgi:sporulation protein YlmC with PRC-barrel domain
MATYNTNQLVRLSDTDEFVLDPTEDVRGRKVKDSDGADLGKVKDLLIDQEDNKVRALVVDHGHFLEKTTSVIPVDAIYRVSADEVHITQNKEKVAGSSVYDPTLVYDADYYFAIYDYYGYSPYWYDEYVYPAYPYYV